MKLVGWASVTGALYAASIHALTHRPSSPTTILLICCAIIATALTIGTVTTHYPPMEHEMPNYDDRITAPWPPRPADPEDT